jgi:hypothetical protein
VTPGAVDGLWILRVGFLVRIVAYVALNAVYIAVLRRRIIVGGYVQRDLAAVTLHGHRVVVMTRETVVGIGRCGCGVRSACDCVEDLMNRYRLQFLQMECRVVRPLTFDCRRPEEQHGGKEYQIGQEIPQRYGFGD